MKRLSIAFLVPFVFLLTGCPEDVPEVECTWELPDDPTGATPRVPQADGFALRISVSGSFTAEQLPAVRFSSDVEGDLFDSGIAILDEGCAGGCPAGDRLIDPITPGPHTLTAQALTPLGTVACEASSAVEVNSLPVVESVTISPSAPLTSEDATFEAVTSDSDGDTVTVSNSWTGPAGQELVGDTLTNIQTAAGEVWTLTVIPRDGLDVGESVTADVTIANTPPLAPTVAISPVPGRIEAALHCAVTDLDDLDPDDQELTVTWSWTRDGDDAGIADSTVPASEISAGELWACAAVVSDGIAAGPSGTASTDVVASLDPTATASLEDHDVITGLNGNQFTGDANTVGSPGDIDGDGLADIVIGVSDQVCTIDADGIPSCNGQAHAYFFSGGDGVPATLADADADFLVPAGSRALAPWRAGDLNGDDIDDLVLPYRSATQPSAAGGSGVYVIFGSSEGFTGEIDATEAGSRILNEDGEEIATAPCPVGDVDGDGFDDLGITAPFADLGTGKLYVVYGHAGGWASGLDVGSLVPGFQIVGSGSGQIVGQACAGPIDLDANGVDDIVVSATGAASQGQGRVLVYLMDTERLSGSFGSSAADTIIDGDPAGPGGFGAGLAALGDHDGDGLDDFAVFAFGPELDNPDPPPNNFDSGTVHIVSPGDAAFGPAMTFDLLPYTIVGGGDLGFCGHPAGVDFNGDGLGDLACGNTRPQGGEGLGELASIRVFLGASGEIDAARTWEDADIVLTSPTYDHLAGLSVVRVGDRDGDFYDELLVGAPGRDGPLVDSGAVYLVDPAQ